MFHLLRVDTFYPISKQKGSPEGGIFHLINQSVMPSRRSTFSDPTPRPASARSSRAPTASPPIPALGNSAPPRRGGRGRRDAGSLPPSLATVTSEDVPTGLIGVPPTRVIPGPLAPASPAPPTFNPIDPTLLNFIQRAITDGLARIGVSGSGSTLPAATPAPDLGQPLPGVTPAAVNLTSSFAAVASPLPTSSRMLVASPFATIIPPSGSGQRGGGGTAGIVPGNRDRSKAWKVYVEKLSSTNLTITATAAVTTLNETFLTVAPMILQDALECTDLRAQLDWIWNAFKHLTPRVMWDSFVLKSSSSIGLVRSTDDLLDLLARHLFKEASNPTAARQQFDSWSFDYRSKYLETLAMELLTLAQAGFLSPDTYVNRVILLLARTPVATVVNNYWKLEAGANYLDSLGLQAFNYDKAVLQQTGQHMLMYLGKVQTLLPALQSISTTTPQPGIVAAVSSTGTGIPCKNCHRTGHRWQDCDKPYSASFPRCANATCIAKNKHLGHLVVDCWIEHPELRERRKKRGASRSPPAPASPSKRGKLFTAGRTVSFVNNISEGSAASDEAEMDK
jgi:hypothetical protein